MNPKPNTPADRLAQGIRLAQAALRDMERAGIERAALADVAVAVHHLAGVFKELPDLIPDFQHDQCSHCDHFATVAQSLPYGDRQVPLIDYECTARNATECPAAKACGFVADDDIASQVPAWLLRQAD